MSTDDLYALAMHASAAFATHGEDRAAVVAQMREAMQQFPIDMVLYCPSCGAQHIDGVELSPLGTKPRATWGNPPHRSHLCHHCKHEWRPCDFPTNGVAQVRSRGRRDVDCHHLDLEKHLWGSLKAAARESPWVQHEFMSDWVDELVRVLKEKR